MQHRSKLGNCVTWICVFALVPACERSKPLAPIATGAPVVTLADYFELGEARVDAELADPRRATDGRLTAQHVEELARAVVRLHVHFMTGGSLSTTHASGVLVDGGKHALTVAHAAIVAIEHPDARVELALGDGRVLAAHVRPLAHYVADQGATDWAVLDVIDPPADAPALEFGAASAGERIVLGFPGRFGRDAKGHMAIDDPTSRAAFHPLRVLARATEARKELELVAGAVPIGGMSGAPCIDEHGHVVALQRAIVDVSTTGGTTWQLDVVELEALRAELAR